MFYILTYYHSCKNLWVATSCFYKLTIQMIQYYYFFYSEEKSVLYNVDKNNQNRLNYDKEFIEKKSIKN